MTPNLALALAHIAPQYNAAQHKRAAERMVQDMEKTAHTPGPWKIGYTTNDVVFNPNQIYDSEGNGVAQLYGIPLHTTLYKIEKDERWSAGLANARLIAASPDLLAALEAMVDALDGSSLRQQEFRRQRQAARAAIDKARGK